MPFVVPKFIERKPKIVGPLTFQQFIYIGGAAGICFILYFTASFSVFLISCFVLIGGGSILAFGKINGRPIPLMLKNFLFFLSSSKIYLWKRRGIPPKIIKVEKVKKEEKKKKSVLNVAEKSRLKDLSAKIEIGQR